MAEVATWTTIIRWLRSLARYLPDRFLRWFWPHERLLRAVETVHFEQAPRFYVRPERLGGELSVVGFNVFNLSPFKLAIVGADLQISLNGREFCEYKTRFPTETIVPPYARSGFWFKSALPDSQVNYIRSYGSEWAAIRISGAVIVRSIYGEHRKELTADVVTVIDR